MTEQDKNKLVITRVLDAPVETIWKYWTIPKYFKRWWGPKYFSAPVSKIDFRVGGKYLHAMQGSDGKKYWSTGIYKEIVPMKKIVVTDSFADGNGNVVPSIRYGMEGFPLELKVTVIFEGYPSPGGGKTKMTLGHAGIKNIDDKMQSDMELGWNQSFDKIAESLAKG